MDGQSVSLDSSEREDELSSFTFRKMFDEYFPYYLYLGMTYEQYWQMDCELVRAYRRAYELKKEYDNSLLWMQGIYVYNALEAQRPGWVFYGKKPPKPEKYMERPIAITKNMQEQYAAEKTQKMAEQFRKAFHKRNQTPATEEGENNGRTTS